MNDLLPLLAGRGSGGASAKTYVEDVFSAWSYKGTRADQNIVNGMDFLGKGGVVLTRLRPTNTGSVLGTTSFCTMVAGDATGASGHYLDVNTTGAQFAGTSSNIAPRSDGYGVSTDTAYARCNWELNDYLSWSFLKSKKFFDMVEWTGNGSELTIPHNLGQKPGMVIVKATSGTVGEWIVQHQDLEASLKYLVLRTTAAAVAVSGQPTIISSDATALYAHPGWPSTGALDLATNGVTYRAFLFGHDTSADGNIYCGSFTTDASGNAVVNCGWEVQALMYKSHNAAGNWEWIDALRGMGIGATATRMSPVNASTAETTATRPFPTANGFRVQGLSASTSYVFMAIRRPGLKGTPTAQGFFQPEVYAGTGAAATHNAGIWTDTLFARRRNSTTDGQFKFWNRLTGQFINSSAAVAASVISTASSITDWAVPTGYKLGSTAPNTIASYSLYNLKRTRGVYDVMIFKGDDADPLPHNLGAPPELTITKNISAAGDWQVSYNGGGMIINTTAASVAVGLLDGATDTTVAKGALEVNATPNVSSNYYIAYLFASYLGISKIGTYVGNGGSQVINCAFTNGARFVMIKVASNIGDWFVWDQAKGFGVGTDLHLSLNTTAAEVNTSDDLYLDSSGFGVTNNVTTNINTTGVTYLFMAFA